MGLLLVVPLPVVAQDAAISGTVTDQTAAVLPGVTVEADGPALSGGPRVAITDGAGRYTIDGLPAGAYTLRFTLSGFETLRRDGVAVSAAAGATVNAVLTFQPLSEEVTVIGSKLDTGRQEFGTSVAYVAAERLQTEPIFTVDDVFNRTANAFTGTAEFGAYSIRGVKNRGLTGSFANSNALASILLNQTAISPRAGDYVKPSLFDVGSVEILRGPQSTIQGPNALVGSVLINYNKPTFDGYDGRVRLEAGGLGTARAAVMQNVEIVDDVLAARVVLETRQARGAVVNTFHDIDDVAQTDERTGRVQLALRPFADDRLTFDLTWLHNSSDSNPFSLVVGDPVAGIDLFDREQLVNRLDVYPSLFDFVNLEANWLLNDRWSVTSVTGYGKFGFDQTYDGDTSSFDLLGVEAYGDDTMASQDLRITYLGNSVDALVGFYYSQGKYAYGFNASGIFPDGMGGFVPFLRRTALQEEVDQTAVFGRVEWSIGEHVLATGGIRFNRETRASDNFALNFGIPSTINGDETFNQAIPSASVSYAFSETTSIGVSYARGFQAGGIAFASFLGQAASYDEEFTNNYEVFVRHRAADGRLTLNGNVFVVDWYDQQVPYTPPFGFPGFDIFIGNVGRSGVTGFEIESEYHLSRTVNVFASLGVTDSEFEEFILDGNDLSGMHFPQAPAWNAAFGLGWQADSGWFGSGSYSYVDESYTEISAPRLTAMSDRSLLDGRFGYRFSGWSIYAWGTNLLDDDYELGVFDRAVFGSPGVYGRVGDPRAAGVGMEYGW